MISDYLEKKHPSDGYKTPLKYNEVRDTTIFFKCINVCSCGEEWEDRYARYQEDCYPYIAKSCKECSIKQSGDNKRLEQKVKKEKMVKAFEDSLPTRYRGNLEKPKNISLVEAYCSILWGGFGTGKTWEAYSVIKELVLSGTVKTYDLKTEIGIMIDLKDNFDNMSSKIKKYQNVDILVVDEIGKNNMSDFNKAMLFEILNYRYDWMKKTILICNAKVKEEIRELLPTSIIDRYRENTIEMSGQSRRYRLSGNKSN